MGDNVMEMQAREMIAHLYGELQRLLEQLTAEKARLQTRLDEVEGLLAKERQTNRELSAENEVYRRALQKLYPAEIDVEAWENLDRGQFNVSSAEFRALLDQLENELDTSKR